MGRTRAPNEVILGAVSSLRTFLAVGSGVIAGGILGAYVTTTIYGERVDVPPAPAPVLCPPCPVCRAVSSSTEAEGLRAVVPAVDPDQPPPEVEVPEIARPGLPASAVRMASAAFEREVAPCLSGGGGGEGMVVLELTVTATGGIGHIRELEITRREGMVGEIEACAGEAARRVQFEWPSGDGESKLVMPLKLRSH